MLVTKTTATVYVGATRRYFSKDAAYRDFAWETLKKKYAEFCDCDNGDPAVGLGPTSCHFHSEFEKFKRIAHRYAERLKKKDRREKSLRDEAEGYVDTWNDGD